MALVPRLSNLGNEKEPIKLTFTPYVDNLTPGVNPPKNRSRYLRRAQIRSRWAQIMSCRAWPKPRSILGIELAWGNWARRCNNF